MLWKENKSSYFLLLILWFLGLMELVFHSKGNLVLWFNQCRNPSLDLFFKYTTQIAEGVVVVVICIVVLIWQWKKGLFLSLMMILTSLIAQGAKRFFDMKRPYYFYQEWLEPIKDYEYHTDFSFPSGHAMSAFTLFFTLSLFLKKSTYKIIFVMLAAATAISRCYLAQHFFIDIYASSIFAVIFVSICYIVYCKNIERQ